MKRLREKLKGFFVDHDLNLISNFQKLLGKSRAILLQVLIIMDVADNDRRIMKYRVCSTLEGKKNNKKSESVNC